MSEERKLPLSLVVLGVVYGDIGTSPLYALRECFLGSHPIPVTAGNVLGVLSLIFWSLLWVISVKYLAFMMRAHNNGEGGILALLALVRPWRNQARWDRRTLIAMGIFGAALLYGDGMITPAISVLSAIEGLQVAAPALSAYVIPITIGVLIALFLFQSRGTAKVGAVFGPVMLLWFTVLAVLGVSGILRQPAVLVAIDPRHAIRFLLDNGETGFVVLGAVFLVVTGGEALYADMGHFGPKPIRLAWFTVVLPALLLNYFGQGALLLAQGRESSEPFYHLAPSWALYPLVLLATVATVIASQAVITGAFSLTRQAIQMSQFPRMRIEQTSPSEVGQIYIPAVNWTLMVATIALVLGFRTSSHLAGAYGVAVSTTMVITTVLAYVVARERAGWGILRAGLVAAGFIVVDAAFFGANLYKVEEGGWFPLLIAAIAFTLMMTWRRGREILAERLKAGETSIETLLGELRAHPPLRLKGTAVFMTRPGEDTPAALLHHVRVNQVLHERVLILTVVTKEVPRVPPAERIEVEPHELGFYRVTLNYGFMQGPNIPGELAALPEHGVELDLDETIYYLGRETLIPAPKKHGMAMWREKLFAFMSRNALRATRFYQLPSDRVFEIGMEVRL